MKKRICAAAAVILLGSGLTVLPASAEENRGDIVILYTNDVHCGIDDSIGYDGLALYKREMEALHDHVLLVDAGDAIQGNAFGSMTKGAYITDLMNTVGYNAAVPGNHEFDYGLQNLTELEKALHCGYISCNLKNTETDRDVFSPYSIVDLGDVQIGFVGVTTPETYLKSTPVFFQNEHGEYIYTFGQEETRLYDIIQENVDKAIDEGADYIILLGHLGENDVTEKWSAMSVAANTKGIHAIIDGHSHEVTPSMTVQNSIGENVIITQTGTKLVNIGKMTISEHSGITAELVDTVPAPTAEMGLNQDSWREAEDRAGRYVDTAVNQKILGLEAELNGLLSVKVGETAFTLYDSDPETGKRRVRNAETNLGDFFTDAWRDLYQTDVAFLNGGGLKASIQAGDITYQDIKNAMPFGNELCSASVTGSQIRDFLEYSVSAYPDEAGKFPSVSGITFTVDTSIESSVVVNEYDEFVSVNGAYRVGNIMINGEPLVLEKHYTAASINYLLQNGGDGFIFSGKCEILTEPFQTDAETTANYIKEKLNGSIPDTYRDPYGLGRIQFISGSAKTTETENAAETETTTTETNHTESQKETRPAGSAAAAGSKPAAPDAGDSTQPWTALAISCAVMLLFRMRMKQN